LGLRWDTLQRKMKKLGIWFVPERGCPVNDRVYYFPTDPTVYKANVANPTSSNTTTTSTPSNNTTTSSISNTITTTAPNNVPTIATTAQKSLQFSRSSSPSTSIQHLSIGQLSHIPPQYPMPSDSSNISAMFSSPTFLPTAHNPYTHPDYMSSTVGSYPLPSSNVPISPAMASSTNINMNYLSNFQNGVPIRLPPIHQVMSPTIQSNYGIPLVRMMPSPTHPYYPPPHPNFSPIPRTSSAYQQQPPPKLNENTNFDTTDHIDPGNSGNPPVKRIKYLKEEDG